MRKDQFLNRQQYTNDFPKKVAMSVALMVSVVALFAFTRPTDFEVFAATATASAKATTIKTSPSPSPKPSPSPSPTASPSSETATENLKDRIDRILEQRQEKLKDLEQAGQRRRAFIGEVQRITERTVTLHTRRGNQSFTLGADVALIKANKAATIDDIAVGDWLGVIGFSDKETIQPQIVIVSTTSLAPTELDSTIGTIKQITKTTVVITQPSQGEKTFQLGKTTLYQANDGTASKVTSLQTETQVIVLSKTDGSLNSAVMIRSLAGQR